MTATSSSTILRPMDLRDRHAMITGGSSGIGLSVAEHFAELGCHVHLVGRSAAKLEQAASQVRRTARSEVRAHACDVGDAAAVDSLFESLRASGASVSVLINSAGQSRPGYFEELPLEVFERLMRVNFFGTVNTCKALAPDLIARRDGYIVNISSVAGLMGVFGYTAYSSSKFAVTGFTESLRAELLPHGVGVSLLCPGDVDTPMLSSEAPHAPKETLALNAKAGILPPRAVTKALVRGMQRRSARIVPGADAKLASRAHRFFPGLVERIMQRTIRRARTPS